MLSVVKINHREHGGIQYKVHGESSPSARGIAPQPAKHNRMNRADPGSLGIKILIQSGTYN